MARGKRPPTALADGGIKYGDKKSQNWDPDRHPTTGDVLEVTSEFQRHGDIVRAAKIAKISVETATSIVTQAMQDNPEAFRGGKTLLWKKIVGEFIVARCLEHAARNIAELDANKAAYTLKIMLEVNERIERAIEERGDVGAKDEAQIAKERAEVQAQIEELQEGLEGAVAIPGQATTGDAPEETLDEDA